MGKGDKKRKPGKRTPSGRLSRSKAAVAERREEDKRAAFEAGPMQTVLQARNRKRAAFKQPSAKHARKWRDKATRPVSKAEVKERRLMQRGSVLGRMLADGAISEQMAAAGDDYCQRYISYAATNGLPRPTPQAMAYGEVRGGSRAENLRIAAISKAEHFQDQRILRQCSAGVLWAIKRACVLDEPAPVRLVVEGLKALLANGR